MKILRVFPRRNSFTPHDDLVAHGEPGLFLPRADEVHISGVFSWEREACLRLQRAWSRHYPVVRVGGPAFGSPAASFVVGMYVRVGVTFTSRGCPRKCPWCIVPRLEGGIVELDPIPPGHIVQDNNLLACSRRHIAAVFAMLREQGRRAVLAGGLDCRLLDRWCADQIADTPILQVFLAADGERSVGAALRAMDLLHFLPQRKKRIYVLCGFAGDTPELAERRLGALFDGGGLPFAQLFQPNDTPRRVVYNGAWRALVRRWSRPAAMMATGQRDPDAPEEIPF